MKQHKLRPFALPFDRINTPGESVRMLLAKEFEGLLNANNLSYNPQKKAIVNTQYGICFRHDFMVCEDFLEWNATTKEEEYRTYKNVCQTYKRRIQRFLTLLETSKRILFLRRKVTKEQAQKLVECIRRGYPDLDFLLVALDNTEEFKKPWNIKQVKNLYLRQHTPYKWSGDDEAWGEIFFDTLGLSSMVEKGIKLFGQEETHPDL